VKCPWIGCFLIATAACSTDSATVAPTPASAPASHRYVLSGLVTTKQGFSPSALIEIMDGADRTRFVRATAEGSYSLPDLTPGSFSIRAVQPGYVEDRRRVTLSADQILDFRLTRAALSYFGELQLTLLPSHEYRLTGSIRNDGDACAKQIRGTIRVIFGSSDFLMTNWNVPADQTLAPAATTTYTACCLSESATGAGTYLVTFEFESVAC
jgi:hypothetical protein